ncbi:MAG: protein kinase, partial [Planctomycetes bacterium]|nr:protein kinase [Planctomycetota bacterium]
PRYPMGRLPVLLPVVDALAHAHEQGVVHRDIKPANVLLDQAGRPRVTDFGLARSLFAPERLTRVGAVVGTPAYMSPEQIDRHLEGHGPQTDVYGLGVLFYEALTGTLPFRHDGWFELMEQILSHEPEPLTRHDPAIPRDLDRIVRQCLAKDPAERYPTARELAGDLERFLSGAHVRARPGAVSSRTRRTRRRHALGVLLSSLLMAGTVLWAGSLFLDRDEAGGSRSEEGPEAIASGWRRLEGGDPRAAREAFVNALQRPDLSQEEKARARAGLAQALLSMGETERALVEADAAVSLDANGPAPLAVRGRVLARLGRHREAVRDLSRLANTRRDDFDLHLELAESWLALAAGKGVSREDFHEATLCLTRLAVIAPAGDPRPDYLLGSLQELRGEAARARDSYERALAKDPRHAPSLVARARLADDPELALADLALAASLPDCPAGIPVLVARFLVLSGRPEEALSALAGSGEEGEPEREELRVEALIALGRAEEADSAATLLFARGAPEEFLLRWAYHLYERGEAKRATEILRAGAGAEDSASREGLALLVSGREAEALPRLEEALAAARADWFLAGLAALASPEPARRARLWSLAGELEADRDGSCARNLARAESLYRLGYLSRVLALARLVTFLGPTDWRGHRLLGRSLSLAARHEEASESFARAIRLAPGRGDLLLEASRCEFARGRAGEGLDLARQAGEAGADEVEAALVAARALIELGRPQDALVSLDPDSRREGWPEVARLEVLALEKADRPADAERARERLEEMRLARRERAMSEFQEGRKFAGAGALQEALDAYGRASRIDPELAQAFFERSLVCHLLFLQSQNLDILGEGLIEFFRALRHDPSAADILLERPLAFQSAFDPDRMIETIERTAKGTEPDPALLLARAFLSGATQFGPGARPGGFARALPDVELALSLDPENWIARMIRGVILREMGRLDAARGELLACHEAHPEVGMIRLQLACLHAELQELAPAVELLDSVLARHPGLCQRLAEYPSLDPIRDAPEFRDLLARRCGGK